MKHFNFTNYITAAIFVATTSLCSAAETSSQETWAGLEEVFTSPAENASSSSSGFKIILAKDSDRGCCVWKTEKGTCTYTNEGFCRTRAKESNIKFEFYKDKSCRELEACK
ncbi:MAG: hypothetical protein E2O57_06660 [Gammaproteobacteria bacterium]|nr:MAG: hypothetical protein E2O57_06660 [Gammaproteobacteria bacterium]